MFCLYKCPGNGIPTGAGHIFSNILLIYTIVQAMVYLLEIKFSVEYDEAVDFHQRKLYPH